MIVAATTQRRTLIAFPALVFLAACTFDSADESRGEEAAAGAVQSPIVGGWPANWAPSVAALVDDVSYVRCSGTLIAPRAVLTAAHCAKPGLTKVLFGQSPQDPRARTLPVVRIIAHPDFDERTLTADIAIAVLAEPAPASVWPATLSRTILSSELVGKNVVLMGYGIDAATMTFGRRGGLARVTAVNPTTFTSTLGPSQPCSGDSGGPALVETEAQTIVLGVVSSGDANCAVRATYTRLDVFLPTFVEPTLAAIEHGTPRTGERSRRPSRSPETPSPSASDLALEPADEGSASTDVEAAASCSIADVRRRGVAPASCVFALALLACVALRLRRIAT